MAPRSQDPMLSDGSVSIYGQFAKVLEHQLPKLRSHEDNSFDDSILQDRVHQLFEIVQQFSAIASEKAFKVKEEEVYNGVSSPEEFENWELEMKLWRLVEKLYITRLIPNELEQEQKLEELTSILRWLQDNTPDVLIPDSEDNLNPRNKWSYTRIAVSTAQYKPLVGKDIDLDLVENLDVDAPLRTDQRIEPADEEKDAEIFEVIYKFVLLGHIKSAIDYAKDTGNFAMALILTGGLDDSDDMSDTLQQSKMVKSTWIKLVYKLSQNPRLSQFERLIYTYLSGGDISGNLEIASASYDEYMNVLINQLLVYQYLKNEKHKSVDNIHIPPPQAKSTKDVLTIVSSAAGTNAQKESTHLIRNISASVMINEVESLIKNVNKNTDNNVLRILTHLGIFLALVKPYQNPKDLGNAITEYVSRLFDSNQADLAPLYLSLIPDEEDAKKAYYSILTAITDKEERARQLHVAKKVASLHVDDDTVIVADDAPKEKLENVLKSIVEREIEETAPYYKQSNGAIVIFDEDLDDSISKEDSRLCNAVDLFYENRMFEDAIESTITIIRRFLMMGKLASLKRFSKDKNFKNLVSDYNVQKMGAENDEISEDTKLELIHYENFVEGLRLLSQWRSFHAGLSTYDGSTVEASLNKTTKLMTNLVSSWLKDFLDPMLMEFRTLYVPYLIIELITIYENARMKDWKYIRLAFNLIEEVANDGVNDYLKCFETSGRLQEFLAKVGQLSAIATEQGKQGLYCL